MILYMKYNVRRHHPPSSIDEDARVLSKPLDWIKSPSEAAVIGWDQLSICMNMNMTDVEQKTIDLLYPCIPSSNGISRPPHACTPHREAFNQLTRSKQPTEPVCVCVCVDVDVFLYITKNICTHTHTHIRRKLETPGGACDTWVEKGSK